MREISQSTYSPSQASFLLKTRRDAPEKRAKKATRAKIEASGTVCPKSEARRQMLACVRGSR
jgi:hypothetical protein